jgi:methionine-rich copper-binding protein CopC
MNWLTKICLMLLLNGAATGITHAHAFMDHADPPVGSKVKHNPQEVRIWFTEPVEPTNSSIKVFGPTGKQIDKRDLHADANNKALLHLSLPSLTPGTYKIIWQVVSVDTHATKGDFTFQFLP